MTIEKIWNDNKDGRITFEMFGHGYLALTPIYEWKGEQIYKTLTIERDIVRGKIYKQRNRMINRILIKYIEQRIEDLKFDLEQLKER